MGYACPVCGDPQSDATHLANHLAFTAMLRGGDHEDWLDEHAPDWADLDEATLGDRVADAAEETEFPQVFEDTTGDHDHAHGDSVAHSDAADLPPGADAVATGDLDEETREVLEEARELTRKRRESDGDADDA